MRVLVTGSEGFIGVETIKLLQDKEINEIGRLYFRYDLMDACDIQDIEQLSLAVDNLNIDRILHLAAIARFSDADRDPKLAYEVNVMGTQNVVDVAAKHHIPLVFASTGSAIMPLDAYDPPYDETIPPRGNSVYGCSKAIGECIVRTHTPHIILRYGHIYGAEKRHHGLVGAFIERINRGCQPVLYGGKQTNDFVYVKDVARCNVIALEAPWDKWNQTYNVGTGYELSAREAGEIICQKLGYTDGIAVEEGRTVDPGRFALDVTKAEQMLGFKAAYSFGEGLDDMLGEMPNVHPAEPVGGMMRSPNHRRAND